MLIEHHCWEANIYLRESTDLIFPMSYSTCEQIKEQRSISFMLLLSYAGILNGISNAPISIETQGYPYFFCRYPELPAPMNAPSKR